MMLNVMQDSLKDYKRCVQLRDAYSKSLAAAMFWINTAKEKLLATEQLSNSHDDLLLKERPVQVTVAQLTCS